MLLLEEDCATAIACNLYISSMEEDWDEELIDCDDEDEEGFFFDDDDAEEEECELYDECPPIPCI